MSRAEPIQVVHLTPSVGRLSFGLGAVALNLVSYQQKRGCHATIWCTDRADEANILESRYGLEESTIKCFPILGPQRLSFSPEMEMFARQALKGGIVVHQHGIWTAVSRISNRSTTIYNTPIVVSPHGALDTWVLAKSKWKKTLALLFYEQKNLSRSNVLHALNSQEALAIRSFGLNNPIAIIPNGVSDQWISDTSQGQKFRTQHGVSRDKRILLFLGRITPKKGLPLLLNAIDRLITQFDEWIVVIAGVDEFGHQAELKALIRRLGLSASVMFVGPLYGADKRDAFAAADVFVLPSHSEGAPVTILEALGAGIPVLTTKASPWEELLAHNCGWWTDISVEAITNALRDILHRSPENLSAMGQRGKRLVSEKYTWSQIAEHTLVLYDWLLNGGDQPAFVVKE